ncbi:MAG: hypothetical protein GOU98_02110 [Candidatus Altiarchaeota archaeon]|jgi:hypothetical protein|nr:hypothetical protein [Candidatus Altiarchaeota archaeon]
MQTKDLGFLGLGAFSILLGSLLTSSFSFSEAGTIDALLTFFVAFLLVFIGGVLWIATTVNVIKEL